MLTDYQRSLFSSLMNHNSEFEDAVEASDSRKAMLAARNYIYFENEMKDDMGEGEYRKFMNGMAMLFSPKEG